jgi:hypothetical protein
MISKPLRPLSLQNAHYQAWGELIASPHIFRGEFDETQQLRLSAQSLAQSFSRRHADLTQPDASPGAGFHPSAHGFAVPFLSAPWVAD